MLCSPLEVTHYSGKVEVGDVKKSANHKVRSDIVRLNSRDIVGRLLSGGHHPLHASQSVLVRTSSEIDLSVPALNWPSRLDTQCDKYSFIHSLLYQRMSSAVPGFVRTN